MTKRVFRSIFLASLAVLLAAVVLILGALYTYFSDVQAEQLRLQTALVAHALETEGVSYFDSLDTSDRRITWIAADGTVLYDSRSDSGVMENHLEREEVKAALATGSGTSFRYSDTLMERYIYTAQRLSDGTVLRLSAAQNTVPHLVLGVVKPIILVIGIAVALSALLAGQLTKNIVAPLNELNLEDPLSNRKYVEIQPLLRRLDSQQVQLRAQSQELRQKQKEFNAVTRSLSEGLVLMNSSGTVLSIKPILCGDETGHIVSCGKVRGMKRAYQELANYYDGRALDKSEMLGIAHADNEEGAQALIALLRDKGFTGKCLNVVYEPVTGAHVGPGTVALFFYGTEK